ncbi:MULTISPECIES: ATP synthase F0 subunit C [Mycoplasmatota]|uniref:ATP synthase subunit c n=1 Tax=Mycoplasmopsis phocirhinis TaxID=142650 RepID=A0A4P6MS32_9BACT|nr:MULTISPECIES: ATP synthase F0 subunit C [Mycoplasmatota]MCS4537102.1 ATP synthase F0 subunit C [Mycoplasma sp. CSL7475-4]MCT4469790.1 ATP synthase F0 subunit C [Mycoplasma sp. HS2188]QBF34464.1 ATP synthase F0 subunit C [Mycoplasmopsis phocirhinis]
MDKQGLIAIGAGICMIGCFGTGLGQGLASGRAAEAVGRNPEAASKVRTIMIIGMSLSETAAIYCFLIAILLLFVFGK